MILLPDYRERVSRIHKACDKYQRELVDLFDEFEATDPELAQLLVDTLECRQSAARFMFRTHLALGEITLYQALADDRRDEVIGLLNRLEHGIY